MDNIIEKLIFDFSLSNTEESFEVEASLESLYDNLLRELDDVFNTVIPADETLLIERLEIDLDFTNIANFKTNLIAEIKALLSSKISSTARESIQYLQQKGMDKKTTAKLKLDILKEFIRDGFVDSLHELPSGLEIDDLFKKLIQSRSNLKEILGLIANNSSYRNRIFMQMSSQSISEMIRLIHKYEISLNIELLKWVLHKYIKDENKMFLLIQQSKNIEQTEKSLLYIIDKTKEKQLLIKEEYEVLKRKIERGVNKRRKTISYDNPSVQKKKSKIDVNEIKKENKGIELLPIQKDTVISKVEEEIERKAEEKNKEGIEKGIKNKIEGSKLLKESDNEEIKVIENKHSIPRMNEESKTEIIIGENENHEVGITDKNEITIKEHREKNQEKGDDVIGDAKEGKEERKKEIIISKRELELSKDIEEAQEEKEGLKGENKEEIETRKEGRQKNEILESEGIEIEKTRDEIKKTEEVEKAGEDEKLENLVKVDRDEKGVDEVNKTEEAEEIAETEKAERIDKTDEIKGIDKIEESNDIEIISKVEKPSSIERIREIDKAESIDKNTEISKKENLITKEEIIKKENKSADNSTEERNLQEENNREDEGITNRKIVTEREENEMTFGKESNDIYAFQNIENTGFEVKIDDQNFENFMRTLGIRIQGEETERIKIINNLLMNNYDIIIGKIQKNKLKIISEYSLVFYGIELKVIHKILKSKQKQNIINYYNILRFIFLDKPRILGLLNLSTLLYAKERSTSVKGIYLFMSDFLEQAYRYGDMSISAFNSLVINILESKGTGGSQEEEIKNVILVKERDSKKKGAYLKKLDKIQKEEKKSIAYKKIGDGIYVHNAGAVLLWPFLSRFFSMAGLFKKGKKEFLSHEARFKAVFLIEYLVTKRTTAPENELVLNKILCGIPIDVPIPSEIEFSQEEKDMAESLLKAVVHQWKATKNTSPDSLRGGFLIREGKVTNVGGEWNLVVEQKTLDILIRKLPWSFTMIKLPWLDKLIRVEW